MIDIVLNNGGGPFDVDLKRRPVRGQGSINVINIFM